MWPAGPELSLENCEQERGKTGQSKAPRQLPHSVHGISVHSSACVCVCEPNPSNVALRAAGRTTCQWPVPPCLRLLPSPLGCGTLGRGSGCHTWNWVFMRSPAWKPPCTRTGGPESLHPAQSSGTCGLWTLACPHPAITARQAFPCPQGQLVPWEPTWLPSDWPRLQRHLREDRWIHQAHSPSLATGCCPSA